MNAIQARNLVAFGYSVPHYSLLAADKISIYVQWQTLSGRQRQHFRERNAAIRSRSKITYTCAVSSVFRRRRFLVSRETPTATF